MHNYAQMQIKNKNLRSTSGRFQSAFVRCMSNLLKQGVKHLTFTLSFPISEVSPQTPNTWANLTFEECPIEFSNII